MNVVMAQKIQSFKILELPKIHRELEKIIKKIARINKDICDEENKLRNLYSELNQKKRRNKFSNTSKIENSIGKKRSKLEGLCQDLNQLENRKSEIVNIKDKRNKEAREIFKDEILSLGLEDYRVSIQVDAYSVNFYFNKRKGQKNHGHYKIDFDTKLIYRREIHQRRSKKCHVF